MMDIIPKTHLGFLSGNTVNGETSLNVIDQTEELSGFLNGDDICNTSMCK